MTQDAVTFPANHSRQTKHLFHFTQGQNIIFCKLYLSNYPSNHTKSIKMSNLNTGVRGRLDALLDTVTESKKSLLNDGVVPDQFLQDNHIRVIAYDFENYSSGTDHTPRFYSSLVLWTFLKPIPLTLTVSQIQLRENVPCTTPSTDRLSLEISGWVNAILVAPAV